MKTLMKRFVSDESGATAIEYGLLATLIAVADPGSRLTAGGCALVIEDGTLGCEEVRVSPL